MPSDDPNLLDPINLFLYYLSLGESPNTAHAKCSVSSAQLSMPTNVKISVKRSFNEDKVVEYTSDNLGDTQ